MQNNKPALERMIELAHSQAGFSLSPQDIAILQKHDPSNPFARTNISREVFSTRYWLTFSGNCVSTPARQNWVDEKGEVIEVPSPLTVSWACSIGKELARAFEASGQSAMVSHGGTGMAKPGQIKVVVPTHDHHSRSASQRYPGSINSHYLVLHVIMQGITGTKELRTFRTDSIGRKDIAPKIIDFLERLEAAMPSTPEEAEKIGRQKAEEIFYESFRRHDIEPDIISITKGRSGDLSFDIQHTMTDTLMRKQEQRDCVRFRGDDPDRPWSAGISSYGSGMREDKIAAEAKRREHIDKHGGLIQTSLAKKIIEINGLKSVPLHTDYSGKTKSYRFSVPTTPPTKGTMMVKAGRIEAEVAIGSGMKLTTGTFKADEITAPDAVIMALKGKPLRHLIDHPLVTDDMVITSITKKADRVSARIRMESHPVEESTCNDEQSHPHKP